MVPRDGRYLRAEEGRPDLEAGGRVRDCDDVARGGTRHHIHGEGRGKKRDDRGAGHADCIRIHIAWRVCVACQRHVGKIGVQHGGVVSGERGDGFDDRHPGAYHMAEGCIAVGRIYTGCERGRVVYHIEEPAGCGSIRPGFARHRDGPLGVQQAIFEIDRGIGRHGPECGGLKAAALDDRDI